MIQNSKPMKHLHKLIFSSASILVTETE